jgi:hypothetical protein
VRGAAPLAHKYAILAWSVAIACWFAAGVLAQQLRGPLALGSDSTSFTDSLDANGQLTVQPHVTTSLLSTGLAVLFYGVLAALWAGLVVLVATGANWARITQTVLGALGGAVVLAQASWSLPGSGTGAVLPGWLDIATLVAIAAAILAMYVPAANAYFAGRPPDAPRPAPLLPRPAEVTWAVRLLAGTVGLGILARVVQAWLPVSPPRSLTGTAVAAPSLAGQIGSVGGLVFGLVFQVLLIVFLLQAANWARILQTIVTAAGAVFVPVGLLVIAEVTTGTIVSWAFSGVSLVLQIIALVLLYRPAPSAFFAVGAGISLENGQQTS